MKITKLHSLCFALGLIIPVLIAPLPAYSAPLSVLDVGPDAEDSEMLDRLAQGKNWDQDWIDLLDYHFDRKTEGDHLDLYTLAEVEGFRVFLLAYPYQAERPRYCDWLKTQQSQAALPVWCLALLALSLVGCAGNKAYVHVYPPSAGPPASDGPLPPVEVTVNQGSYKSAVGDSNTAEAATDLDTKIESAIE